MCLFSIHIHMTLKFVPIIWLSKSCRAIYFFMVPFFVITVVGVVVFIVVMKIWMFYSLVFSHNTFIVIYCLLYLLKRAVSVRPSVSLSVCLWWEFSGMDEFCAKWITQCYMNIWIGKYMLSVLDLVRSAKREACARSAQ